MHRLKFQYLENNAKDKYVKTIVNDEAPMITADTNDALQASNLVKKANLKAAKSRLAQRHTDIRNLAPCVERGMELDYNRLWHLTESA
jgi:transcription elongation GreA/GreB family factor